MDGPLCKTFFDIIYANFAEHPNYISTNLIAVICIPIRSGHLCALVV